jgi:nicotinamide mononucleotide adenylyltransferase
MENSTMNATYETASEPEFTREQVGAAQRIKALLMFMDGANRRAPNEESHNKVIAFVFENMQHSVLVQTLVQRGITDYDELMAEVAAAEDQHSSLHQGLL